MILPSPGSAGAPADASLPWRYAGRSGSTPCQRGAQLPRDGGDSGDATRREGLHGEEVRHSDQAPGGSTRPMSTAQQIHDHQVSPICPLVGVGERVGHPGVVMTGSGWQGGCS